jgi:hypothetical protein
MLNELEAAGRNPELIIFDNISSLTFGMDENSNTEVEPLIRYPTRFEIKHSKIA